MTQPAPLSYSSAELLQSCEQRYAYYKIDKVPVDPDYEKSDALALGSAFHWILEQSRHEKPKSITEDLARCVSDPDIGLSEDDVPLVHAMILKYLRLHQRMGLKVLHVETEIRTEWFHGYIDAIMEDSEGRWGIVDLKTHKSLHMPSLAALPRDPQLNLYAGHASALAQALGLDVKRFAGCRWRVVTKSSAKPKKGETAIEYIARLTDHHVVAYDIPIPIESMNWSERMRMHKSLWEKSGLLQGGRPLRNYKNCFSFYSPCSYWKRCHGKLFSEMRDSLQITVEE